MGRCGWKRAEFEHCPHWNLVKPESLGQDTAQNISLRLRHLCVIQHFFFIYLWKPLRGRGGDQSSFLFSPQCLFMYSKVDSFLCGMVHKLSELDTCVSYSTSFSHGCGNLAELEVAHHLLSFIVPSACSCIQKLIPFFMEWSTNSQSSPPVCDTAPLLHMFVETSQSKRWSTTFVPFQSPAHVHVT